jgi:hypothetical protein
VKTPSQQFNRPVIGKIKTKVLHGTWIRDGGVEEPMSCPAEEFEVIATTIMGSSKVYVCNQWYKEYKHEPQVVSAEMVEEFIPYPVKE